MIRFQYFMGLELLRNPDIDRTYIVKTKYIDSSLMKTKLLEFLDQVVSCIAS